MSKNKPESSAKDTPLYAALRKEGIKKKKAIRVADAVAPSSHRTAAKRGKNSGRKSATAYEKWTKQELLNRAKTLGVKGRSRMTKKQLTRALRAS